MARPRFYRMSLRSILLTEGGCALDLQMEMDDPPSCSGPDSEAQNRRGTPVVPAELGWIIQCNATDATSASLRSGPDKRLSPKDPKCEIGGARLSCPPNWDGLSNVMRRTRQARPSEADLTSGFLRKIQGAKSDGHACCARRTGMDYPM
jgi:hypothetical protein